MRVLITGASGFVGRKLCQALAQSHEVVACVRSGGAATSAIRTVEVPDLSVPGALDRSLDGVEAVVHLAGRAHVLRETAADPEAAFRLANTVATGEVAASSRRAGVKRFVFISTAGVHGLTSDGRPFTETSPLQPHNPYTRSKLAAEEILRSLAGPEFRVSVLRPPLIYGPEPVGNFRSLLRAVLRGMPLPLASVRNRRTMLYTGNLTSLIEACLTRPAPEFAVYLAADRESLSTPELIRALARASGRKPSLFRFPPSLLAAAALTAGLGARWRQLSGDFEVDGSLARKELGWDPPFAAPEALERTAREALA